MYIRNGNNFVEFICLEYQNAQRWSLGDDSANKWNAIFDKNRVSDS